MDHCGTVGYTKRPKRGPLFSPPKPSDTSRPMSYNSCTGSRAKKVINFRYLRFLFF